ncbi:MAG: murein biosynthesis integral membrane protein MurJ [Alphaproteobacteria bacterium]|nr:murein biosynthesis integral membrane protein MurJ [Alphaproteobacteria bacterium]
MSFARAVATVGGFTMLSRVAGFARDMVIAAVIGAGPVADAFFIAFKLPNFFRRLFAEGAFASAFVPLFARELQAGGRAAALGFAREAQAALLAVLLPFTAILIAVMPWLMRALAPGLVGDPATFALAIDFGRIAFPYLMFISLVALYGGVLNSIEHFGHAAATPILLNLVLIAAVLGLTPLLPNGGYAAALGVLGAGIVQFVWLAQACRRAEVGVGLTRPVRSARIMRLLALALPTAIAGGVQQIGLVLDVVWASFMPAGAISALWYADRVAQLPLGVVGVAIGTALLPLLARHLRAGDAAAAASNQNRALEVGLLLALPAALALAVLAEPVVRILFERGHFSAADTQRAAGALAAFAAGLPAFVLVKALLPAFYAREDTRTPLYAAILAIAVNVALNLSFLLATSLNQVGIALASALSGWINVVFLGGALLARRQLPIDDRLRRNAPRIVLASAVMTLALWLAVGWLAGPLHHATILGGATLAGICLLGGGLYAGAAALLGVLRLGELRALLRRAPGTTSDASDSE